MDFPRREWVHAWVDRVNTDPECVAAGADFHGAVAVEIVQGVAAATPGVFRIRLEGESGRWLRWEVFDDRTSNGAGAIGGRLRSSHDEEAAPRPAPVLFTIRADSHVWRMVIEQKLHPIKAIFTGHIRVHGKLSSMLHWARAFRIMTVLAADIPTTFPSEAAN